MIRNLLTAAFVILLASEVQAACFKPADAERMAEEQWSERIVSVGVAQGGGLLRIYNNPETGTWTITLLRSDGHGQAIECVMSSGEGWRDLRRLIGDPA